MIRPSGSRAGLWRTVVMTGAIAVLLAACGSAATPASVGPTTASPASVNSGAQPPDSDAPPPAPSVLPSAPTASGDTSPAGSSQIGLGTDPSLSALSPETLSPQAASVSKPDIYGCFTWGTGYAAYSGLPVYLEYWNSATGKQVATRVANTNSSGCVRFNDISVGYYYLLEGRKIYLYPLCYYYD